MVLDLHLRFFFLVVCLFVFCLIIGFLAPVLFIPHPPPGPNEVPSNEVASLQNDTRYQFTNERYLPVM